jgi:hypothetical protein
MFKKLTAILFLLVFGASTFCQAVIVANYYANTAAYAKNCENKARPMMHCNGKCQMMKQLQEEEKQNQDDPGRKADNKNETLSSKSFYPTLALSSNIIAASEFFTAADDCPQSFLLDVFHPPQA